jgi:hypothetical protein
MKTTVKMLMDHNPHLYEAKDGKWGTGGGRSLRRFLFLGTVHDPQTGFTGRDERFIRSWCPLVC